MIKKSLITFFSLFCLFFSAHSQQYKTFNFDSDIDTLLMQNPNGFALYFSALWCGPCLKKSKQISNFFSAQKNVGFIFVYDPYKFSSERGEKLLKDAFTKNINYVMDPKFYTSNKAIIQINPQSKAIDKIRKILTKLPLIKGNLNDFAFGQLLFFNSKKEVSILNLAYDTIIADSLLESFCMNNFRIF